MKYSEFRKFLEKADNPEDVTINTNLDFENCNKLQRLPKRLSVDGSLNLEGCSSLTSLPEVLNVHGCLYLRNCASITRLPTVSNISVLQLDDTSTKLLQNSVSGSTASLKLGNLDLQGCKSLCTLPENLELAGWLDIRQCMSLTHLPKSLTVAGYVHADELQSIVTLNSALISNRLYTLVDLSATTGIEDIFNSLLKHTNTEEQLAIQRYLQSLTLSLQDLRRLFALLMSAPDNILAENIYAELLQFIKIHLGSSHVKSHKRVLEL